MSTRYVWDTFDIKYMYNQNVEQSIGSYDYSSEINDTYHKYGGTSYTFDENTGKYTLSGGLWIESQYANLNAREFPYLALKTSNSVSTIPTDTKVLYNGYQNEYDDDLYWYFIYLGGGSGWVNIRAITVKESDLSKVTDNNYTSFDQSFQVLSSKSYQTKGNPKGKMLSSSYRSKYPDDGIRKVTGSAAYEEWCTYKGSDNIDPYSVNYSSDELEAGKSITVTLNPRSNTYGGTVYYQYSYSTNGGTSWTNYGGKTTSTSQNITVPSNATQFRVRVQTSDDMGFTSTDYVTGTNLEVSQMKAYVGEKGIARKVDKMYIGVDGVARQVIKGYVGVDGIARKFL